MLVATSSYPYMYLASQLGMTPPEFHQDL